MSWAGDRGLGAIDPTAFREGFHKKEYKEISKERQIWAPRNPTSKGKVLEDRARVLRRRRDVRQESKAGAALEGNLKTYLSLSCGTPSSGSYSTHKFDCGR